MQSSSVAAMTKLSALGPWFSNPKGARSHVESQEPKGVFAFVSNAFQTALRASVGACMGCSEENTGTSSPEVTEPSGLFVRDRNRQKVHGETSLPVESNDFLQGLWALISRERVESLGLSPLGELWGKKRGINGRYFL